MLRKISAAAYPALNRQPGTDRCRSRAWLVSVRPRLLAIILGLFSGASQDSPTVRARQFWPGQRRHVGQAPSLPPVTPAPGRGEAPTSGLPPHIRRTLHQLHGLPPLQVNPSHTGDFPEPSTDPSPMPKARFHLRPEVTTSLEINLRLK